MKIRNKIILFSFLWLIIILLSANTLVFFQFIRVATTNEQETLRHKAENILYRVGVDELLMPNREQELKTFLLENSMIRVLDAGGKPINLLYNHPDAKIVPPQLVEDYTTELNRVGSHRIITVRLPIYNNNKLAGTLEIAEMLIALENNVRILISILFTATACAVIMAFFGGITLSRIILGPIKRLIYTMEEIEGSLSFKKIPLPRKPKDELYKMTATFNRMIERIRWSFARQEQFVSDASHELKTTLTIIESYTNMLKRWGLQDAEVQREAVETIHSETIRMKKVTQQLLDLASSGKDGNLELEHIDLLKLCRDLSRIIRKIHKRDVNVDVDAKTKEIIIYADKTKMKQLLLILLDNALKYSQKSITIELRQGKDGVRVRVIDLGIGIPADELDHVFERFYRVDKARTRTKSGGTGLGLPIAKAIVQEHRGTIQIASEEGKGTAVSVLIP